MIYCELFSKEENISFNYLKYLLMNLFSYIQFDIG